jgi:hypothetical protein
MIDDFVILSLETDGEETNKRERDMITSNTIPFPLLDDTENWKIVCHKWKGNVNTKRQKEREREDGFRRVRSYFTSLTLLKLSEGNFMTFSPDTADPNTHTHTHTFVAKTRQAKKFKFFSLSLSFLHFIRLQAVLSHCLSLYLSLCLSTRACKQHIGFRIYIRNWINK